MSDVEGDALWQRAQDAGLTPGLTALLRGLLENGVAASDVDGNGFSEKMYPSILRRLKDINADPFLVGEVQVNLDAIFDVTRRASWDRLMEDDYPV